MKCPHCGKEVKNLGGCATHSQIVHHINLRTWYKNNRELAKSMGIWSAGYDHVKRGRTKVVRRPRSTKPPVPKPFVCNLCDKTFIGLKGLSIHLRSIHYTFLIDYIHSLEIIPECIASSKFYANNVTRKTKEKAPPKPKPPPPKPKFSEKQIDEFEKLNFENALIYHRTLLLEIHRSKTYKVKSNRHTVGRLVSLGLVRKIKGIGACNVLTTLAIERLGL